ncbi:MAG: glutamine synthetase family protein [Candidatus Korarchaeum sp.]
MQPEDILKWVNEGSVDKVELEYVDILGYLRSSLISAQRFLESKVGSFDASSVKIAEISRSDASLVPDFSTSILIGDTCRILCEIWEDMGRRRSRMDPRFVAERTEEFLLSEGYRGHVGAEIEFFVLGKDLRPVSLPWSEGRVNYMVSPPLDPLRELEVEVLRELSEAKLKPEVTHHEVSSGQLEISLAANSPLRSADSVIRAKRIIREVATRMGSIATFMPKPVGKTNGSGMHFHMSLWDQKGERNLFYDEGDEYAEISQLARYFIGGILEHVGSLAALVAPTVNSYRRLVPGFEAPVYACWGRGNRSAAVRVPVYRKGVGKSKRIEFRVPDPSCNPYTAFSAVFLAGLDGVRRKLDPGDPVDFNVYEHNAGLKRLPRSLYEALDELESDNSYLRPAFDTELLDRYLELKRREALELAEWPSEAEYRTYLIA